MRPLVKVKVPAPSTILLFFSLLVVVAFPSTNGARGLLFIGLAAYLLFMMFVNRGPIRWIHALWVICFYVLTIFSRRWSAYPSGAEVVIGSVTYAFILNWSLGEYVYQGKRSLNHICALMVVVSTLLSFNFILNSSVDSNGRFSLGINANIMGINAAYLFGILLYGAKEAHWKKWHMNVLTIAIAVIAILTGSRKALMMLLLFTVCYMLFWRPEKNMTKFFGRIFAVVGISVFVIVLVMKVDILYDAIGNRLESLYLQWVHGEDADASAITRDNMIDIGMRMFRLEPLLGLGHNAFKLGGGYFTYSHNNYVELLCSLGICGFAIFYIPLVYFLVESFRLWKRGVPGAVVPLSIFIIQFINDWGQVSYYSFQIHIFLGIAVGYVYLLKKEYRQGKYDDVLIPCGRSARIRKNAVNREQHFTAAQCAKETAIQQSDTQNQPPQ